MRHPIDIAVMFTALWVLLSMILDIATPKDLNVYMIGAATAPAVVVASLLYYLRFPLLDFTIMFSTLWLLAAMAIEWIAPTPLSPLLIVGAFAPGVAVGIWLYGWPALRKAIRRSKRVKISASPLESHKA